MKPKFTAEQIYKLTIEKAIREDKHPMEVLEEVKKLIEQTDNGTSEDRSGG